jgi:uncharacterized protein
MRSSSRCSWTRCVTVAWTIETRMLLVEVGGRRMPNIWIGPAEAEAINSRLHGIQRDRPMTHDLMANLLRPFDVDVARVVISRFEDAYRAEVHVRRDGRDAASGRPPVG